MTPRGLALPLAAALALSVASCVSHRSSVATDERAFGVYRCSIVGPAGALPQFRILLFAQLPDRLHAEVLGPMGGPRLILDTGAGAMSVTDVGAKVAYTGKVDPEVLARLLGVRITIEGLVRAILDGSGQDGELSIDRRPERRPGLPEALELAGKERSIRIVLLSQRAVRAGATLGNGEPPGGVEVRPLEQLADDPGVAWPADERAES